MSVPPEWVLASFARHLHFTRRDRAEWLSEVGFSFGPRSISDYFVADEMAYPLQALVPMLMLAKQTGK